jgi:hypothetical protein
MPHPQVQQQQEDQGDLHFDPRRIPDNLRDRFRMGGDSGRPGGGGSAAGEGLTAEALDAGAGEGLAAGGLAKAT